MGTRIICIYTPLNDPRKGNLYWFHTVQTRVGWPELTKTIDQFIQQDLGINDDDIKGYLDMGAARYDVNLEKRIKDFLGNEKATIRPISRAIDIPWYHVEILFLGI